MKLLRTLLLCLLLGPGVAVAAFDDTTYVGRLPCGHCAQRQATLTLFADHHFRLRLRDLDADGRVLAEQIDLGTWLYDGDGRRLLRGGREAPLRFELLSDGSLRGFDAQGRPLPGPALAPQATLDRLDGPLRLRGLYSHLADAARFQDCRSGRRWPVAIEGAHLALERAYLAQGGGGRWVLATLDGRFELREPEPGLPPRETLVVERFDRLWPGETCAADMPATAALLNTRWRLVAIDEQPVQVGAGGREPWLQLLPDANRLRGFGGCNGFQGRFAQGSDGLQILYLAATRRSCPEGAQEARYLDALRATASRQVVGDALLLRDAQGRLRLRFEALYLR
jgi:heat shock protein HslJ/uncharacterized lipoprotein NlpE involved in copper resistance